MIVYNTTSVYTSIFTIYASVNQYHYEIYHIPMLRLLH